MESKYPDEKLLMRAMNLFLCILRMLEDVFSIGAAYMFSYGKHYGKHAYSNILKILLPKTENFQIKILLFFHISAQNIDCGYSLEPLRRF